MIRPGRLGGRALPARLALSPDRSLRSPVSAPGAAPAAAPFSAPISAPDLAPTAASIVAPIAAPAFPPDPAPVSAPVRAPFSEPVSVLVSALVSGLVVAATVSGAALAADDAGLAAPHLDVVARTPEEAARIAAVTAAVRDFGSPERFEEKPGGAATVRVRSDADAFSLSSANMPFERELDFKVGNGLFRKVWVSSPSSTLASDGLGPLYNARSCQRCHLKDGRGHPPRGAGRRRGLDVPATVGPGAARRGDERDRGVPALGRRRGAAGAARSGLWRAAPGFRRARPRCRIPHGGELRRDRGAAVGGRDGAPARPHLFGGRSRLRSAGAGRDAESRAWRRR